MSKKLKLPAPFQPQLQEPDFERKILKRIHVQSEADFARALYRQDGTGGLVWAAELDKKGTKRLKTLAKDIQRNRGFVSWGKFAILGTLVVLILVFYLIFKNMLLTGWLEEALEGAFGAKAEVAGLDFDPIGGRFAWNAVQVADKDHPLKNLFQLGRTELKVDTWQLVNGKVLIENLQCSDARFGTDRKTSGALAKTARQAPAPASAGSSVNLDGFVDLNKLDAASLVNDQWKNLETAKLIDQLKAQLGDPQNLFAQQRSEIQSKTQSLAQAAGDRILKNLQSVRSPSDIQDALKKSTDFQGEIDAARKQGQDSQNQIQNEYKNYQAQVAGLQSSAQRDLRTLKNMAANPLALGGDVVKKILAQILGPKTQELLGWADKAKRAAASLQNTGAKQDKPRLTAGRVVSFPVPQKPAFWIKNTTASVWFDPQHQASLQATGITSDSDMIGEPIRMKLIYSETNFQVQAEGLIDTRRNAQQTLEVTAQVTGYPFTLSGGMEALGIQSLSGAFGGTGTLVQNAQDVTTLQAQGAVSGLSVKTLDDGLMARISKTALSAAKNQVTGSLRGQWGGSDDSISVTTNLDSVYAQALRSEAEQQAKSLQAGIQNEINKKIDEALGGKATADQWRKLVADNASDVKSLDDLKAKVDKQISDLQKLKQVASDPSKLKDAAKSLKLPKF